MKNLINLISLIQLILIPYHLQAATSTDVKITSYVTEPVCTLDVPSEIDLGENWAYGDFLVRPSFTIKISCENNNSVPTWLTAYAENPSGSAVGGQFTVIKDSNGNPLEYLYFFLENGSMVKFDGFSAFCAGSLARECKITPRTMPTSGGGEGEGKVWIALEYN